MEEAQGQRRRRFGGAPDRGKPTVKQIYALAGALCERCGEKFPETLAAASELIERLRNENGGGGATRSG
ncbi:MAG: hypothetical protein H0V84_06405 [Actinobacteria bacterium]|nr:hypothetical protein [Actinomycetota bacterium]